MAPLCRLPGAQGYSLLSPKETLQALCAGLLGSLSLPCHMALSSPASALPGSFDGIPHPFAETARENLHRTSAQRQMLKLTNFWRLKAQCQSASRVLLWVAMDVWVPSRYSAKTVFHAHDSGILSSFSFNKSFGDRDQTLGPAHTKHVFSHLGIQQASVSSIMTSDLNRMT